MNIIRQSLYFEQSRLVHAFYNALTSQYDAQGVTVIETHISWVLLAGRYAYKIKKPIDLGFLDFSTLEARRFYCEEEIRLNRRLAPKVYLNVVAIGGRLDNPVVGGRPAIEYAVRMRRFPVTKQFDRLATKHRLLPSHIDNLAGLVSRFHQHLIAADVNSAYGTPHAIHQAAEQNFEQLQPLLVKPGDIKHLSDLQRESQNEFAAIRSLLEQRLAGGFVRECHGDLHLGNIVLMAGQAVPFDGIEFNPALRWIDVMSEIAFTVMDLQHFKCADLAYRFLNAYLESTGDYEGVRVLRFYLAYRATVRAKVYRIRATQPAISAHEAVVASENSNNLLLQAAGYLERRQPSLIITHGLPGSGKTTFSQIALERMQLIRVRSDVERKRLYAVAPLADSRASTGLNLYSAEITHQTYARLLALTRTLLVAGYSVIVDAAFADQAEREPFRLLADELKLAFVIASIQANTETLRTRITQRLHAGDDASEADLDVLAKLQKRQQPLSSRELDCCVVFNNEGNSLDADTAGWHQLQSILAA